MKKNLGVTDKIIRIILAVIIAGLYFTRDLNFTLSLIAFLAVSVLVVTTFVSFCPIYYPFGIFTKKKE